MDVRTLSRVKTVVSIRRALGSVPPPPCGHAEAQTHSERRGSATRQTPLRAPSLPCPHSRLAVATFHVPALWSWKPDQPK